MPIVVQVHAYCRRFGMDELALSLVYELQGFFEELWPMFPCLGFAKMVHAMLEAAEEKDQEILDVTLSTRRIRPADVD